MSTIGSVDDVLATTAKDLQFGNRQPCYCDLERMVEPIYEAGEKLAGIVGVDCTMKKDKDHREATRQYLLRVYGPWSECDNCKEDE